MLMLMVLPQVESGLEDEDPWATEEKVAINSQEMSEMIFKIRLRIF